MTPFFPAIAAATARNPIYVGGVAGLAGFALLMPTVPSLLVLTGSVLSIRSQVRREERYLAEAYGNEFRLYASKVGRFLPWVGRST